MVQSNKGKEILEKIRKSYDIYQVDNQKAIELDGPMVLHSAIPHNRRDEYYTDLDSENLNEHINKYIPITAKDILIERAKIFVYKCGLYEKVMKLKKVNERKE